MPTQQQELRTAIQAFLVHKKATQTSKANIDKIVLDMIRMRIISRENIKRKIASRSPSNLKKSINAIDFGEGEALLKELEKIIRQKGKPK
jgi:hypothetical protein